MANKRKADFNNFDTPTWLRQTIGTAEQMQYHSNNSLMILSSNVSNISICVFLKVSEMDFEFLKMKKIQQQYSR